MAKIGHYFRVTAQIERGLPKDKAAELEKHLRERVNNMDIGIEQENRRMARYELAVASCLLGIVPTRHEKATNLRENGEGAAAEIQEKLCQEALDIGLEALETGLKQAPEPRRQQ